MRLRINPATGDVAQWIPDGPGTWAMFVMTDGAHEVVILSDEDVSGWQEVVTTPKPAAPVFALAVACPVPFQCQPHGLITDQFQREQLAARHEDHDAVRVAVRIHHPSRDDDAVPPEFVAGDAVTFHGSTTGHMAGLVDATVQGVHGGESVPGYDVTVDGRVLFVPATALAAGG